MEADPKPLLIEYKPNHSALAFHNSDRRVKAICGPMGSGKSTMAIMEIALAATEAKVPLRILVLRESYRQLKDSTKATWNEWLGPCSLWVEQDKCFRFSLPNKWGEVLTHEAHFRHARRVEEASNLLSTEYAIIWLEEPVPAFQMSEGIMGAGLPEGMFNLALGRQRQKGATRFHILLTFNPPSRHHWIYKRFFKPTAEDLAVMDFELFRSPPKENTANLPKGYYEILEKQWDEDLVRRFVLGEVVTIYPGKPVFTQFHDTMHFKSDLKPIPGLPFVLMLDFGLTPCCIFSQVKATGQLRCYQELQMFESGATELGEAIRHVMHNDFDGFNIGRIWGDPAGAARAQTDKTTPFGILFKILGVPVMPGDQDIYTRLEAVRARAKTIIDHEPGILIDRDACSSLMEGLLGAYRYPGQAGEYGASPLKNNFSHLADALQYGCSREFDVLSGTRMNEKPEPKRPRFNPLSDSRATHRGSWMVH